MKNLSLTPILFLLVFAFGCSGNKKENHDHAHHDHGHEHHHHEAPAIEGAVTLNNGERWETNPETNEGIDNMMALVAKEAANGPTDLEVLQTNLREEFNTILQKCTMKGESHNQLHNYLHPLKEKIDGLDQAQEDAHAIEDLEQYLHTYKTYFR